MNIILSIHPKWAKLIYEGKKTIEWRTTVPRRFFNGDTLYLYETSPVKRVTGKCYVRDFHKVDVRKWYSHDDKVIKFIERWQVPVDDLLEYQGVRQFMYAWEVYLVERLDGKTVQIDRPPQRWCYTEVDV